MRTTCWYLTTWSIILVHVQNLNSSSSIEEHYFVGALRGPFVSPCCERVLLKRPVPYWCVCIFCRSCSLMVVAYIISFIFFFFLSAPYAIGIEQTCLQFFFNQAKTQTHCALFSLRFGIDFATLLLDCCLRSKWLTWLRSTRKKREEKPAHTATYFLYLAPHPPMDCWTHSRHSGPTISKVFISKKGMKKGGKTNYKNTS